MSELHQNPDGLVIVRTDDGEYIDTLSNYLLDGGLALPELPKGADDRVYTQDKRHALMGGGDLIEGGPMPWTLGDRIIASVATLLAAQAARLQAVRDAQAAELAAFIRPITALQARRVLRAAGLYDAVKAAVDNVQDVDARDSWEYATLWRRDAPWIGTLSKQLGMTDAQVDTLFKQAATYKE